MGLVSSTHGWVLAGAESTYGTDPTPTNALVLTAQPTIGIDRQIIERARVKATSGKDPHCVIPQRTSFSIPVAVGGVEDADDGVPSISPLLIASGHTETTSGTSAGGDVEALYKPASTAHGSCTLKVFRVDKTTGNVSSITLVGCRGNISFSFGLNAEVQATFEGEALYAEWTEFASGTAPTSYGLGVTPFCSTAITLSHDSTSYRASNIAFQSGWDVGQVDNITPTSNTEEITLSRSSRPGGSFNAVQLATTYASGGLRADSIAAKSAALEISLDDGTRTLSITATEAQLGTPSDAADGAFMRHDTPFFCNEGSSGDDDYSITFGLV